MSTSPDNSLIYFPTWKFDSEPTSHLSASSTMDIHQFCMDFFVKTRRKTRKFDYLAGKWKLLWIYALCFALHVTLTSSVFAASELTAKEREYLRRIRHQKGQYARYKRFFMDNRSSGYRSSLENRVHPSFDPKIKTLVTEPLDEPAYLHCKVKDLGNYKVTWIRKSDGHILTVDQIIFTQDDRIALSYREPQDGSEFEDWCLLIKYVKKNDSGEYECQLSTEPAQSLVVSLNVTDRLAVTQKDSLPMHMTPASSPKYNVNHAAISGTDKVRGGDSIVVSCEIEMREEENPPAFVKWAVNNTKIETYLEPSKYRTDRTKRGNVLIHTLEIQGATINDTGTYSCKADNSPEQSMLVQVNGSPSYSRSALWVIVMMSMSYAVLRRPVS